MSDSMTSSESSFGSTSGSSDLDPMPDPKPVFEIVLAAALELGVLTYVAMMKVITIDLIFASLEAMPEIRAKVYSACTGMAEKFAIKHSLERQISDIKLALEIEDEVAERFVRTVGIPYYVEHIKLDILYQAVMESLWFMDSSRDQHRVLAARFIDALVLHNAFNGSSMRTYERILKAITIENVMGDQVPAELRASMLNAVHKMCRKNQTFRLGHIIFNPEEGGVSFMDLASHIDVAIMVEPFVHYATELGLAAAHDARESEIPPPPDEVILVDGGGEDESLARSVPPPLPKKEAGNAGEGT
ncbi:MAG: hypothetical protein WCK01_00995 [Candidatus Uhrbacteria bacterium]